MTTRRLHVQRLAMLVIAVIATAVAAQIDVVVPGSPVPQSLQTLAVVLTGVWLGPRGGAFAMLVYVLLGALGLPLFAGGAAGTATVLGPTGGYLAGFVIGALVCGILSASPGAATVRWRRVVFGALAAHVVILGCGWLWLTRFSGAGVAWQQGVSPFIWGGVIKSGIAAAIVVLVRVAVAVRD